MEAPGGAGRPRGDLPGVAGQPAWGLPQGRPQRHSEDQQGPRDASSAPAPHWLWANSWAGFGGTDRPHSPHPSRAGAPPLQEGWSLGAAPLHLQLWYMVMQSVTARGFLITKLGWWEEVWFNINSLPGLGKGRLWGDLLAACSYLDGVTGKESQALWGSVQRNGDRHPMQVALREIPSRY